MKIGFFGDGPWAERALAKLARDPAYELSFVAVRFPCSESPLVALAQRLGFEVLSPQNINAPEVVADIAGRNADLHVSMSYDQILRAPILGIPRAGTLNCHAGALPFYRGRNPLTWAIINGESAFGVTVHWVDTGIDTGDIVLQVKSPISPDDDYASLLRRAHDLCADTLVEAIDLVRTGRDARIAQASIDPVGLYCCRRRQGDERITWEHDSRAIHNFVRALVPPGPGARTWHGEAAWAILKTEYIAGARSYAGIAGEVVGRDEHGILVKTGDSLLRVSLWAPVGADDALGTPAVPAIARGARLGRDWAREVQALRVKVNDLERRLASLTRGQ